MKNDSKERLEKQLNDNPELKDRFDLQMTDIIVSIEATRLQLEPFASSIKAQLEVFRLHVEKMREPITRKLGILETEYDSFVAQYLSYFNKTGFIQPKDFDEFFIWFARFRHPDEPFGSLEMQENDFKLFHEYKERKLNYTNWNDVDEYEFLNSKDKANVSNNPDWSFTALQWSAIFYYVAPDLYGKIEQKKNKLQEFINEFKPNKAHNSLSNKHSEIVRVLNGDENNELKKKHLVAIKKILPFLKDNYPNAFIDADEDYNRLVDNLDRK